MFPVLVARQPHAHLTWFRLDKAKIACAVLRDTDQARNHPAFLETKKWQTTSSVDLNHQQEAAGQASKQVYRFTPVVQLIGETEEMRGRVHCDTAPIPSVGQHNKEVLMQVGGLTEDEVVRLASIGAVAGAEGVQSRAPKARAPQPGLHGPVFG